MGAVETLGPAPLDERADQVMVPMRDGVRLATDVYLTKGRGPWPAVLVRLPYDKAGRYTFMPALAPHFTERGYAFVVQDVRGKFRSEGVTMPFEHEVSDGHDTLEWLTAQPWSNGAVGMWGDSYYGFTQWAALASGHHALRAMVPRVTSADLAGGDWSGGSVPALYVADYLAHYWAGNLIHDWEPDWDRRPLSALYEDLFAAIGVRSAGFDAYLLAELGRGPGFRPYPGPHPFAVRPVPTLHSAGWFDNLAPASFRDYMTLAGRPGRGGMDYLIVDSTDHENYRLEDVPVTPERDHDVDDDVLARMIPIYLGPALSFFDRFLGGRDVSRPPARVRWHLGHAGWREEDQWPPRGAAELTLYLSAAGRAAAGAEGGDLVTAPGPPERASWVHDPSHLVPSAVVDPFAFLREYPDESELGSRPDVLTFTGEPAAEPLDLAGPVAADLALGTTGPSMHVFVKLLDVAPDGSAHMLTRGQALLPDPDPDDLFTVDLNHVGYRLLIGHRLRLQITSSDYPLFVPHPGTGENPWTATLSSSNQQTLTSGGVRASRLRLTSA